MPQRYVVFSHGKDSGPWGTKITALAATARDQGCAVESVDYRGLDTVEARVERLVQVCSPLSGELVLAGSSLGGYVSVAAAALLPVRGLFLMAPALYLPPLPPLRPGTIDCPVAVVHGWRDAIVPPADSVRFAQTHRAALHLLDGDHQLHAQVNPIQHLFQYFLAALDADRAAV